MKIETILLWCFNYESAKSSLTNIFIHFHTNPSSDPRFNLNSLEWTFIVQLSPVDTWLVPQIVFFYKLNNANANSDDFSLPSSLSSLSIFFSTLFSSSGFRFGLRVKWLIIFRLEIHFIDFFLTLRVHLLVKVRCRPPPTVLSPSPTKYLWFRHYRRVFSFFIFGGKAMMDGILFFQIDSLFFSSIFRKYFHTHSTNGGMGMRTCSKSQNIIFKHARICKLSHRNILSRLGKMRYVELMKILLCSCCWSFRLIKLNWFGFLR